MIFNAVEIMTPILLAALGGLFAELAGVLNIALEGLILAGAFAGILAGAASGSLVVGMLAGALAGGLLAAVFTFFSIRLRANIFITGLAVNLLAAGSIPFISTWMFGTKGVLRFPDLPRLPRLLEGVTSGVGFIDSLLFGHSATVYLAWLLVPLALVALYRTPFGLRLRAVGAREDSVIIAGVDAVAYRRIAVLISGVAAGLAGAAISLRLGVYLPNISAGRGWIALVAIYLGYRHPIGILIAALLFGFTESLAGAAQGLLAIPGTVLLGLPYAITVVAMITYSALRARGQRRRRFMDAHF
ncbi:MAG: ABC transporter permease [Spirochaetaceae bacterium]|nr:MAG: ABC transporter permease [Spirochaetaceae bacterium]